MLQADSIWYWHGSPMFSPGVTLPFINGIVSPGGKFPFCGNQWVSAYIIEELGQKEYENPRGQSE
jgi:hypothetical protein